MKYSEMNNEEKKAFLDGAKMVENKIKKAFSFLSPREKNEEIEIKATDKKETKRNDYSTKESKKKEFKLTREEVFSGKTKSGKPVYDGIFNKVGTDEFVRAEKQCDGTNIIRKRGKAYKVKGQSDISTSIHWWRDFNIW